MAKHWNAYSKWVTKDKEKALDLEDSHLIDLIGEDKLITVFHQDSMRDDDGKVKRWNNDRDRLK